MNREQAIKNFVGAGSELDGLTFPELVHASTNCRVVAFEAEVPEHEALVAEITSILSSFLAAHRAGDLLYEALETRTLGNKISETLVSHFRGFAYQAKMFNEPGYPFWCLTTPRGAYIYGQVKVRTDRKRKDARNFYFSTKGKAKSITKGGHHVLVAFDIEKVADNSYRLIGYNLIDLGKLHINIKPEFNAGTRDLYRPTTILSSTD